MQRSCNGNGNGFVTVAQRSRHKNERFTAASSSGDVKIRIWDLMALTCKFVLQGHRIADKQHKFKYKFN